MHMRTHPRMHAWSPSELHGSEGVLGLHQILVLAPFDGRRRGHEEVLRGVTHAAHVCARRVRGRGHLVRHFPGQRGSSVTNRVLRNRGSWHHLHEGERFRCYVPPV